MALLMIIGAYVAYENIISPRPQYDVVARFQYSNIIYESWGGGLVTARAAKKKDRTVEIPTTMKKDGFWYKVDEITFDAFRGDNALQHIIPPPASKPGASPSVLGGPGVGADSSCHLVEGYALLTRYGAAFRVIRPWGKHEQGAVSTRLEITPRRFVKCREAILQNYNQGLVSIEGSTRYLPLAWGDAGTDHNGSLPAAGKEECLLTGDEPQVLGRCVVMATHLQAHGHVQKPLVADGGIATRAYDEVADDSEEVWILAFHHRPPGIVADIGYHRFQLSPAREDGILIAGGEK